MSKSEALFGSHFGPNRPGAQVLGVSYDRALASLLLEVNPL